MRLASVVGSISGPTTFEGSGLPFGQSKRVCCCADADETSRTKIRSAKIRMKHSRAKSTRSENCYLMSRQFRPSPTSATMGIENSATCSISCFHQLLKLFCFPGNNIEQQLVVNLQRHPRLQLPFANQLIDPQHSQLNQVRRRSLQRSIDRSPLRKSTHIRIARLYIRNRPHPPKVGPHRLFPPHCFQRLFYKSLHTLVPLEVRSMYSRAVF